MRRAILVGVACGLTLAMGGQADASTTLGHTFGPSSIFNGAGTLAQTAGPPFFLDELGNPVDLTIGVPSPGVITSWSFESISLDPTSPMKFQVLRAAAGVNDYTTIHSGPLEDIAQGTVNTFAVRFPVQPGDLIANHYSGTTPSFRFASTDFHTVSIPTDVPPGHESSYTPDAYGTGVDVDLAATLEADADSDGYGDETQDLCPTDPSRQTACAPPDADGDGVPDADDVCPSTKGLPSNNGCPAVDDDPPETSITRKPKAKTAKSKARFRFTSDEPASTFECKLKGRGLDPLFKHFHACGSPRTYKNLKPGKYQFKVRATDPTGNVDATPAEDHFKVVR